MTKRNTPVQKRVTRNGKVIIQKSKKDEVKIYDVIGFIIVAIAAVCFIILCLTHLIREIGGN